MTLTLFLVGCTVQTQPTQLSTAKTVLSTPQVIYTVSLTPLPSLQSEETKAIATVTSTPIKTIRTIPNYDFHFGATPEMSQIGGISGVFYRLSTPNKSCAQLYHVFRFYEDGLVIYVPVCEDKAIADFGKDVWVAMSEWFTREKIDITTSQGIYYISGNKIWFTTVVEFPSHTVVSDYLGTFSKDRFTLDRFTHPNGYEIREPEGREEYVWLDIPEER